MEVRSGKSEVGLFNIQPTGLSCHEEYEKRIYRLSDKTVILANQNEIEMDNVLKYRLIERIIQIEDDKVLNEIRALLGLTEMDFLQCASSLV